MTDDAPVSKEALLKIKDMVEDKKQRVIDLDKKIKDVKQRITAKQKEGVSLKNDLAILKNRIAKTELDIETVKTQIEQTVLELDALSIEIKNSENKLSGEREHLGNLTRALYRLNRRSYFEILLVRGSFSDFLSEAKYVEDIQRKMLSVLREVKAAKAALEKKKAENEEKRRTLVVLKIKFDETREKLNEENLAKSVLYSATIDTEREYAEQLRKLREEEEAVNADIIALENRLRSKLEASDSLRGVGDLILSWPLEPTRGISAYFHDPEYPFRKIFEHPAIDIRAYQGTPVKAAAPGFVARVRNGGMGYSYIMLIHRNGISTVYGHLSKLVAEPNTFVDRGDIIGYSGGMPGTPGAGYLTTGPHLHFEVRSSGTPVDPLGYLIQ